jgi:hypothetical protein
MREIINKMLKREYIFFQFKLITDTVRIAKKATVTLLAKYANKVAVADPIIP